MKIVVTAQGEGWEARLDPRFGRAKYFTCVDLDTGSHECAENRAGQDATQGAGISAARAVAGLGAQSIVTGHVGPKAFKALAAAGIRVWLAGDSTVREAVEKFRRNELAEAKDADVEGHW